MKYEISIFDLFGKTASNGELAYEFRVKELDRYYELCESITLDFTNFRMSNSSFMNALVAPYFEQHGRAALNKITFKGCMGTVKVLVEGAVSLGLTKHQEAAACS